MSSNNLDITERESNPIIKSFHAFVSCILKKIYSAGDRWEPSEGNYVDYAVLYNIAYQPCWHERGFTAWTPMITNKWLVELSTNSQQLGRRQLYVKVMDPFCLWGILLLVKFVLSCIVKISIMWHSLWILSPVTTPGCTIAVELHQPCEEKGYRKHQSGLSTKWQVPC